MSRRVESVGVSIEQKPNTNNRRVSAVGVSIEQKPNTNNRRVSAVGVMIEQKPDTNNRRVSAVGVMVEYKGALPLTNAGNIASEEAWGIATVTTSVSGNVRITQLTAEALSNPEVIARISQLTAEALSNPEVIARISQLTAEALSNPEVIARVSQLSIELLWENIPPPPPPPPAPVEAWICDSLASYFYVLLCDVYGTVIALFDNFEKLEYSNVIDEVGYFSLTLNADDPRVDLFALDGVVKVRRSIPGLSLDWYDDFIGLYRTSIYELSEDGREMFTAVGVSSNDMLMRTSIGYKAGTIRAAKNTVSETAMKEYVYENCGIGATIALGRQADGVLPGFLIDSDTAVGDTWAGDRAGANLLDTLKEIASYSGIDYEVKLVTNHYVFYTYPDQYGLDRTVVGLDPYTGKNAAGNYPVIFSTNFSNIKTLKSTYDRIPEVNRIFMLGKGDGSTRVWKSVTAASVLDSIYNRREVARSGSNQEFLYQLTQAGIGELSAGMAKLEIQFVPFQQPSCAYGKHYRVGDRVSLIYRGVTFNYKLMACKVNVGKGEESLDIVFANEVLM